MSKISLSLFLWPTDLCVEKSLLIWVCVCVNVTHAGAQAAWQARPPFGWLASRREHGRGRKWSLAAGSRKDWKSSSPAMNRHRDTKHGSQSSTTHRPPEPKQPHANSPHHAPTAHQLTLNLSINTEEWVLSKKPTGHAAQTHSADSKHPECHACLSLRCLFSGLKWTTSVCLLCKNSDTFPSEARWRL